VQTSKSVLIRLTHLLARCVFQQTDPFKLNTMENLSQAKCLWRFSTTFLCRGNVFRKEKRWEVPSLIYTVRCLDPPSEQYAPHVTISSREMLPTRRPCRLQCRRASPPSGRPVLSFVTSVPQAAYLVKIKALSTLKTYRHIHIDRIEQSSRNPHYNVLR